MSRGNDLRGWITMAGDVDWSGVSGMWGKKGPDGSWYVIQFDNMYDSCGESDCKRDGCAQYYCQVKRLDLSEVSAKDMKSAIESCGWEDAEEQGGELARVECCIQYGIGAPLWSDSSDVYPSRLRANARREAEGFMRDKKALNTALDRPVNKIGSTARDFGKGDIDAGLRRYVTSGDIGMNPDPTKDLMLKICGMPAAR